MKKDEYCSDAIAIKLLDYYEGGEFSYEEGSQKTAKQRTLKKEFKIFVEDILADTKKKRSLIALQDTILGVTEPDKLRAELSSLRNKVKVLEDRSGNEKILINTLYKEELRKEIKENYELQTREDLESSRIVNRKLLNHIINLEEQVDGAKNRVDRDVHEELIKENRNLSQQIYDRNISKEKSKKDLKREKLKKQMEALESSDEEEEEIIIETI